MTYTFKLPQIEFEYGTCYELKTPWLGNPTHPGCILDIEGDYCLTFFFSTKPMSKYYSGWEDQEIFPKGEGGKSLGTFGMPNGTKWIHKKYFIKKKKPFSPMYIDQMYEECEKFFKKDFEKIDWTTQEWFKKIK